MMKAAKTDILAKLQQQILAMQGFKTASVANAMAFGLGSLEGCFPNGVFPTGTLHELICQGAEQTAASEGFMAGLLAKLMESGVATAIQMPLLKGSNSTITNCQPELSLC